MSTAAASESSLLELYDVGVAQVYGYLFARCAADIETALINKKKKIPPTRLPRSPDPYLWVPKDEQGEKEHTWTT